MYLSLPVEYPLLRQTLIKLEFSWQIFEKYWNIKCHDNLSSRSRTVLCGQTGTTKQILAFCYFAIPPNKGGTTSYCYKGCLASNTIRSAASAANAECLPRHLDFLIGETYNWFSRSATREVCYRELSATSNAVEKPLTIPHACDTRWLPIRACSGEYKSAYWMNLKRNSTLLV